MRITDIDMLHDIKTEYRQLRENGMNRTDAVTEMMSQYQNELTLGQEDDGLFFWIGLADAQYALKELSEQVAQRATQFLRKLEDMSIFPDSDIKRRRDWYAQAPMPERASVRPPKRFRCQWKIGDTFAYPLSGPQTEELGVSGAYILLRKVDEAENYDGRLLPIVTLTLWTEKELPQSTSQFYSAPMLKLASGRLGTPEGSSFDYRVEILFSDKKQLSDLHFCGNFVGEEMPADGAVFCEPGYTLMLSPQTFLQDLFNYIKRHQYWSENGC